MALLRTGAPGLQFFSSSKFTKSATKPIFENPIFVLPSSLSLQRRHAARKGYREQARKKKSAAKVNTAVVKAEAKLIKKFTKITKTIEQKKPEAPDDDIILRNQFNYIKYSLPEIIGFHREHHHPTVYNNPSAPVSLKIEIRMIGKKETQFLKPFSGIAPIPHPFSLSVRREILVFCKPDDVELAFKCGATMAGGADLIKKIKEGSVQPVLFDYVLSHTNMLLELTPIRNLLKLQFPKLKTGTLTSDLKSAIHKFLHGVEYSCVKVGDSQDFGVIGVDIGTLDMETSQIEENFKAIIKDVELNRPKKEGKFITWIWCMSRPSTEEFSVELSKYIESERRVEEPEVGRGDRKWKRAAEDEDDDDDDEGETKEAIATKNL